MSRHRVRCADDAADKRGNHATGTEISRPSASATRRQSRVHRTSTARGSSLSGKVLVPPFLEVRPVRFDDAEDLRDLMTVESFRPGYEDRLESDLRVVVVSLDVYVRRLGSLFAEEEESIPRDSEDGWHLTA